MSYARSPIDDFSITIGTNIDAFAIWVHGITTGFVVPCCIHVVEVHNYFPMKKSATCALCLKESVLKTSHLLPKAIIKWLKDTSATGYLRQVGTPNVRRQDILKEEMLCSECELLFSKFEEYFMRNFFHVHVSKHDTPRQFLYNETLLNFVASVNWRTLSSSVRSKEVPSDLLPWVYPFLEETRKFLLGQSETTHYEHHLFFLGEVESIDPERAPSNFHQYLLRGIDTTIATQAKRKWYKRRVIFQYTKIPYMCFVSFIKPKSNPRWIGTQIYSAGQMSTPQEIRDPRFGSFILDRAKEAHERYQQGLSAHQSNYITEKLFENPYRALMSDTHKAILADERIKKGAKSNKGGEGST